MVLIDILDEGLDAGSLNEFLLIIAPLDLRQVTGDACDQQMWESMLLK